jgi:hypothetical protein
MFRFMEALKMIQVRSLTDYITYRFYNELFAPKQPSGYKNDFDEVLSGIEINYRV